MDRAGSPDLLLDAIDHGQPLDDLLSEGRFRGLIDVGKLSSRMGQTKRQLDWAGRTASLGQAVIASVAIDLQQPLIAGAASCASPSAAARASAAALGDAHEA